MHVCEQNTYIHIMERTRGAGVSFPLFTGKTPWKHSQLSEPKLIQEFYKSPDRKHGAVLHFHLSPVNSSFDSLCCSLRRKTHKADSYSNSLMTRVDLAEWSAFYRVQLVASCVVSVNTKPFKTIDWRSCCQ